MVLPDSIPSASISDPESGVASYCTKKRCGIIAGVVAGIIVVAVIIYFVVKALTPDGSCIGRLGRYEQAAVSTDTKVCSEIGKDILSRENASVADGAIAALLCMGLVNFHSLGIGGGSFLVLYRREERKFYALDSRETAPLAADKDMYKDDFNLAKRGALSIAVPGELAGFWELHQQFGGLPWKDLFEPSIKLCREGIPIGKGLVGAMTFFSQWVKDHPVLGSLLVDPETGEPKKVGETYKLEKLADTLQKIADGGASEFYTGNLTDLIVEEIQDAGGIITHEDLAGYEVKWREPRMSTIDVAGRQYNMAVMPPPSSGSVTAFILGTMNGFDNLTANSTEDDDVVKNWHRFLEVSKYAYAARTELGDDSFVNKTNKDVLDRLLSEKYMAEVREAIQDEARSYKWYGDFYNDFTDRMGTGHLSIVDKNGDAISATSTINFYFGSKIFGNRTYIMYNNEMDDFSLPGKPNDAMNLTASETNYIAPGKRPMSSMSPIIVTDEDGDVRVVSGASGAGKIISAAAQVMWRSLLRGQSLKEATDTPRAYEQWVRKTDCEHDFDKDIYNSLKTTYEHNLKRLMANASVAIVQSIERKDGALYAYADKRKGGCVNGF